MVHKHHTFTLILGAVFGIVLSLGIAFLTFYGLTRLPWFAENDATEEKTQQFLSAIANSLQKAEEQETVPEGIALEEEAEQIRIFEVLGTVLEADVRGFDIRATVGGSERVFHVEYTASTLMSRISSGVPGIDTSPVEETVIGPKQIKPDQVVIIYTTTQITEETETIAARQVKQVQ